jgi:hypothetical protein
VCRSFTQLYLLYWICKVSAGVECDPSWS